MAVPHRDAVELHQAFEGFGCDQIALIRVLANKNSSQRQQIRQAYKNTFDEDLCDKIKSKLYGDLKKAMLLWILTPAERDATILRSAMRSALVSTSKRNKVLVEILWTKSKEELDAIASVFASIDGRSVLNAIQATVKNENCRELFLRQLLCKTTCGNATTTHNTHNGNSNDIEYKEMLETIQDCTTRRAHYFAKVLYKSMKGLGTDDDTLIRVVVTRAEVDMPQIKTAFTESYRTSLKSMICDDTSGNYRTFLLAAIGEDVILQQGCNYW